MAYDKTFTDGLQFMWGKGFLSPGGPEEIREILRGHDLRGKHILDIGSGLGGIDMLLVREHGAAHVTGIDVDAQLIDWSRQLIAREGLAGEIAFQLVTPGPLPFADQSFDVVFSKDAMVHIHDKAASYRDIIRVLKTGGKFLASDWLWAAGAETSPAVDAWLHGNPLGFAFTTPAEAGAALRGAGFTDVGLVDRRQWLANSNRQLIRQLEGPDFARLASLVGEAAATERLDGSKGRQRVLDAGDLIPTHLKGVKPDAIRP